MAKILFTSIPKCGTHLMLRYFDLLGLKNGGPYDALAFDQNFFDYLRNLSENAYSAWHYRWTPELSELIRIHDIKVVFLYRDPRAQICSRWHFVMKTPHHRGYRFFAEHLKTQEERVMRFIEGFSPEELQLFPDLVGALMSPDASCGEGPFSKYPGGVNNLYRIFARWRKEPDCCSIRFEDIIGPKGGGSSEKQLQVVRELMDFTGNPNGKLLLQEVADSLFDERANTFRMGQIDSWRREFTPALRESFMRESCELLKYWGYQP